MSMELYIIPLNTSIVAPTKAIDTDYNLKQVI
jgi:hypothetical protein